MKALCTVLLIIGSLALSAQKEKVFTVAKKAVQLNPDIDTLIAGTTYQFQLIGIKTAKIERVTFNGGTALMNDSGISITIPSTITSTKKYSIRLFAYTSKNPVLAYEKVMTIVPAEKEVKFNPVNPPMFVDPFYLYWDNTLLVRMYGDTVSREMLSQPYKYLRIYNWMTQENSYKIKSFKLTIGCGKDSQVFASNKAYISKNIADAIGETPSGCKVSITELMFIRDHTTSPKEKLFRECHIVIR